MNLPPSPISSSGSEFQAPAAGLGVDDNSFAAAQLYVLERIACGDALPAVLERIVRLIERQSAGMACSILLLDHKLGCIRHGAAPNLPREYVEAIDGAPIGPEAGSCGAAAHRGEPVIIDDIATHPFWANYRHLALPYGLRACWSTPIFSPERKVLGTFAMYYHEPRRPAEREIRWVEAAAHLAAVAMQRDQAETAIRESEARYRQIVDTAYEGVWLVDGDRRTTFVNERMARMLGYTREEMLGRSLYDFMDASLHDECDSQFKRRLSGVSEQHEFRLRRKDGSQFWTMVNASPVLDDKGEVTAALGMVSDITERKRTEKERQQLIHDLGERVKELTVLHGAARLLQAYQPVTREFLTELVSLLPTGWQYADICEARIVYHKTEACTPGWRETPWRQSAHFSGGGQTGVIEVVYLAEKPAAAEGPFLAEERKLLESVSNMLATHLDHRRVTDALQRSETQLRIMFESAAIGMALVDTQGRPIKCNLALERFLGYSEAELCGMTFPEFTHPDDVALDSGLYFSLAEGERDHYELDKRYICKNGQVVWGRLTVSAVFGPGGEVQYAIGMVEDVTGRKQAEAERARLEAQLHQAQKMQSLGTLCGGIAHDFNNILAAIIGNTRVALEKLAADHPAGKRIADIEKGARRATDLVRQILTFSRQEDIKRDVIRLQPVIEEAVALLRSSLMPRIQIRTLLSADTAYALADANQIHQLVMNLGTNAAQAIGERGGVIEVRVENVEVDAELACQSADLTHGPYVRLSIQDNGCGMEKETLERIFEPFFTTKPPGQGTGLGLSVVHGIMRSHNGAVTVFSEPQRGATFHLYFPAVEGREAAPTLSRPDIHRAQGEHILYVDDEEPLVYLTSRILEDLGYRVSGFTDSEHALQAFRLRPHDFDAVVSDIAMPGIPGVDLAREIMTVRPGIPLVLTSGYFRPEDVEAARELGIADLIHKPDSIQELGEVLHRLLAGKVLGSGS